MQKKSILEHELRLVKNSSKFEKLMGVRAIWRLNIILGGPAGSTNSFVSRHSRPDRKQESRRSTLNIQHWNEKVWYVYRRLHVYTSMSFIIQGITLHRNIVDMIILTRACIVDYIYTTYEYVFHTTGYNRTLKHRWFDYFWLQISSLLRRSSRITWCQGCCVRMNTRHYLWYVPGWYVVS